MDQEGVLRSKLDLLRVTLRNTDQEIMQVELKLKRLAAEKQSQGKNEIVLKELQSICPLLTSIHFDSYGYRYAAFFESLSIRLEFNYFQGRYSVAIYVGEKTDICFGHISAKKGSKVNIFTSSNDLISDYAKFQIYVAQVGQIIDFIYSHLTCETKD